MRLTSGRTLAASANASGLTSVSKYTKDQVT